MQIELIGCTCAGKSTLARRIVQYCGERGIPVMFARDFVARRFRLDRIPWPPLRSLAWKLVTLSACLTTVGKYSAFYGFAIRTLFHSPATWYHKYRLFQRILRQIGIYEMIRRAGAHEQFLLVDEGSLHAAHNLFVYAGGQLPDRCELSKFLHMIPLPDVVVLVRQSEFVLTERTQARGHPRIPRDDCQAGQAFIRQAVEVFDWLANQPAIAKRLLVVNGLSGMSEGNAADISSELAAVRNIFRNAMQENSPGIGDNATAEAAPARALDV